MRRIVSYTCLLFVLFSLIGLAQAQGGVFRIAGAQMLGGAIKSSQNSAKYQVRMCATTQKFAKVTSTSKKYIIHLGCFDDAAVPAQRRNAARLWAFYE